MPRSSGLQLSRSIRGSRLLKAIAALVAVLCGLLVAGPKLDNSPARADGPPAGYTCVLDTYSTHKDADGTLGCYANYYPVFINGDSQVNYLAMGDSYSSGESVPPFVKGSLEGYDSAKDKCDRSYAAASAVLEDKLLFSTTAGIDRQFIACSGAETGNLVGSVGQNGEPSQIIQEQQIESLTGSPDLVTLTIGGNNIGFANIINACFWDRIWTGPFGKTCGARADYVAQVDNTIAKVTPTLESAFAKIVAAVGPDASVLVADYPQIFPSDLAQQKCKPLNSIFDPIDLTQMNTWTAELDANIKTAANAAGVHFVEVSGAKGVFAGHKICDTGAPWINILTSREGTVQGTDTAGSFHPKAQGQAAYAKAYDDYILAWRKAGRPLNSAGFPADAATATSSVAGLSRQEPTSELQIRAADDTVADTIGSDDLTVTPSDASACPSQYAGGESLHVSGGGYAAGTAVTVAVMPSTPEEVDYPVVADSDGSIGLDLVLPATLTGAQVGSADLGYIESDGAGSATTTQTDSNLFPIGDADPGCGVPTLTGAQASVELMGSDTPDLATAGATFAVDGPGLPSSAGAAAGSFAELNTDADELTTCSAQEPAGVQCVDGVIGGLTPDATYTVTQLGAPSGYGIAAPVTVTATDDGSVAEAAFTDTALGADYESGTTAASCLLCLLSATGTGSSLSATGNSRITWAGIGTSDSTSATATTATGSSILTGQSFFNSGGVKLTGTSHLSTTAAPTAGSTADPFSWYALPAQVGGGGAISATGSQVVDAQPGVYSKLTASGNARLTLEPGTYVVTGGVSVSGSAQLTASGATIYLACSGYPAPCAGGSTGSLAVSGAAVVSLTGGAVGPGDGFALLTDPAEAAALTVGGSASLTIDGTVEAPASSLAVTGSATVATTKGELVLSTLSTTGSASVSVQGDPVPAL